MAVMFYAHLAQDAWRAVVIAFDPASDRLFISLSVILIMVKGAHCAKRGYIVKTIGGLMSVLKSVKSVLNWSRPMLERLLTLWRPN